MVMMNSGNNNNNKTPLIGVLRGHTAPISAIKYHDTHNIFISGDQNGQIHLWRDVLETRRSTSQFGNNYYLKTNESKSSSTAISKHDMVLQLCWMSSSSPQHFISQTRNCVLSLYDVNKSDQQQQPLVESKLYSNEVVQTSFCKMAQSCCSTGSSSPCLALPSNEVNDTLSTTSTGEQQQLVAQLFDCSNNALSATHKIYFPSTPAVETGPKLGMLMALSFHNTREYDLYAAFENGQVYQWDIRNPNTPCACVKQSMSYDPILCLKTFQVRDDPEYDMLASSNTGKFLSFQPLNNNMTTNSTMAVEETYEMPQEGINDLLVVNNGKLLCTAGWDHRVRIFEIKKQKKTNKKKKKTKTAISMEQSSTHECYNNSIGAQKMVDLKPLAIYKNHTSSVTCIDSNPDDTILVSGSQDERLCVWSLQFNSTGTTTTSRAKQVF